MEKITAIIVDDEAEARYLMARLLADFYDIEVLAKAENAETALITIKNLKPDLIFLDIDMPRKNGFELLEELKTLQIPLTVIFVTAYNQFAIQAIKHAAFDYLVKPIDIDDLKQTIDRYKSERKSTTSLGRIETLLQALQEEKLQFSTRTGFIFLNPAEIIYCKAEGNYTDLYMINEEKDTVTINIGKIESLLPQNKFMKINRSVIINKQYLTEINRKEKICLLYVNDEEISFTISLKYFNTVSK